MNNLQSGAFIMVGTYFGAKVRAKHNTCSQNTEHIYNTYMYMCILIKFTQKQTSKLSFERLTSSLSEASDLRNKKQNCISKASVHTHKFMIQ